jgi:hypothetical protein
LFPATDLDQGGLPSADHKNGIQPSWLVRHQPSAAALTLPAALLQAGPKPLSRQVAQLGYVSLHDRQYIGEIDEAPVAGPTSSAQPDMAMRDEPVLARALRERGLVFYLALLPVAAARTKGRPAAPATSQPEKRQGP